REGEGLAPQRPVGAIRERLRRRSHGAVVTHGGDAGPGPLRTSTGRTPDRPGIPRALRGQLLAERRHGARGVARRNANGHGPGPTDLRPRPPPPKRIRPERPTRLPPALRTQRRRLAK